MRQGDVAWRELPDWALRNSIGPDRVKFLDRRVLEPMTEKLFPNRAQVAAEIG